MNKLIFLFFLSFSVFFIACSDDPSDPCDKCTNEEYCVSGVCLPHGCSVEHPNGSCPLGEHCNAGTCELSNCSAEYPNGHCTDPDEECVNGTCEPYKCSRSHPDGFCPDGKICLSNFRCGEVTCSENNTNGTCQGGYECSADGTCIQVECDKQHPNGACTDPKNECVDGECLSKNRCSEENPHGDCALHERCMEGTCTPIACGPGNPDGSCPEGEYCDRGLEGGGWVFLCKEIPVTCSSPDDCIEGYKCKDGTCVAYECNPECLQHQVCIYNQCRDENFFCNPDNLNGWCEDGTICIDGICGVPVNNPCDGIDCGNDYCIVTDWDSDTGYECVEEGELCSGNNTTGKCDTPLVCKDGVCSEADKCADVTCNEGDICNPYTGDCVLNYCQANPNSCVEDHTICVNLFNNDDKYQCPCELGYDYSFTEGRCIQNFDACTDKDCGEGICITDNWAVDGWECVCNTGMEYVDENTKHLCVDPATYDYCTDWNCGVGSCEEITNDDGSKYAQCNCPENFYFKSEEKTCVPGIICGDTFCENPLRDICINNQFCEPQQCGGNYPEGTCGNAESCVPCEETGDNDGCNGGMKCELTEECSELTSAGYCMDGYSCSSGICCKGGNCTTTDGTLKHIGETCDTETNNCVNDGICVPTPTGDGVCHKLCDQNKSNTCSDLDVGNTVYHCVGRDVFNGVNYNKIGVCAVDDNCSKFDNGGCQTNQVCLGFRRTNFTQCYAFEETVPLGASCTTGTTAMGFNLGCDENLLCVDGTCVPNCSNAYRISSPEINLCYNSFTENFEIDNLKVKAQDSLTFNSKKNHRVTELCNPANANCGNSLSCVKVQDKNIAVGVSKDIGLCSETCNFDATSYKDECGGSDICFKSGPDSLCLSASECDPVASNGCAGDEICYPVTKTLNSCMTTLGDGHIGEACTETCQYGICINGICDYPCSIGDNSSCDTNSGETCQATTDPYLNSSSHFGSPSSYGTCE